ncbi:unnamed protein product [Dicrocoelium dendriticum]|nr:unnamed protein product [Dicrocoelium dendriticum]
MGFEMKLGWGKSVPIPLYPIYIPPALLELIKPPPPSGLPFNAQPREWLKSLRLAIKERAKLVTDGTDSDTSIPPGPDRKPFDISKMGRDELNEVLKDAVVKVVIPSDRSVLALIHRLIEFVVLEGPQFEAAIMHREQNNPQFKFLFDYQSSEHAYYRWKLWSILHGESVNNWRTDEFRMFECGPLWRPPPMNLFSGGMPEDLVEEDDYPYAPGYVPPPQARRHRDADVMFDEMYSEAMAASRRCGLTEAQRGRFTQMLIDLEPSRSNIGDVMVWCLEHADSAADIACCVVESLSPNCPFLKTETAEKTDATKIDEPDVTSDEKTEAHSPISKIIARLFLISDILYNSSAKVPNASYFRKCFQDLLPGVFTNLHATYKNVEGKLKAEQLKQKVMLCFRAWEDWAVYPNDYLIRLQNIFLGLVSQDDDDADLSGVPLDYDPSGGLEIPGKRFNATDSNVEILEAQPLVQYDGDPLDVDGSPLGADEPPEKSIASRPPTQTVPKPVSTMASDSSASRLFVPSKWETVDPETVEAEAVTTTSRWELLVDSTPQHSTSPGSARTTNDRKETTSWRQNSNAADDDDLDGQPLIGLVAYDDEDAASSVSSEPDSIPLPSSAPPPLPSTTVADSSLKQESSVGTSSVPTNTLSEERRARLRDIELKVLRYQDELESSRKGDKSITEEAINKQIQRYRERLLERLNEDAAVSPVPSKSHSTHSKSRSSKSSKGGSSSLSANLKQSLNESSISPPSRRDSRDRSPPRSFRERDRVRRRAPSPNSPLAVIDSYDSPSYRVQQSGNYGSPYIRSRMSTSGWDQDNDDFERRSRGNSIRTSLPREDLEEGEASDEEDSGFMYAQLASRRKHGVDDKQSPSLRHFRKRQRSHSPDSPDARQHSYRSRTPSPSRKRSGVSLSTNNSGHKRKL